MIRAVIFDFTGVLAQNPDPVMRRAWASRLALDLEELERRVFASDLLVMAQRGQITPDAFWEAMGERLGLPEAERDRFRRDFWADEELDTRLLALVGELRSAGYRVGMLTNAMADLQDRLHDEFEVYNAFDAVHVAALTGLMKPEPEAYRSMAGALGVSTPECVLIDDNTANVDGARLVGMQALLYRTGMDVQAALTPILEADPTRAIIFDFGNVLDIPEDREAWHAHREALAASLGLTGNALGALFFQSEAWHQVKVAAITFDEYLEAIFGPLGLTSRAAQQAAFDAYFDGRAHIHPEMRALLHELKPRYRLGLLSNAYQLEMDAWLSKQHGLDGIFDDVISSAAVRMAKPDEAIYRLALDRLGVRPGEALFIDDLARNTIAAESVGVPSIDFESPEQLRHELAARGLL